MACAAVLIGIVTLQVAVLRLNSERGDLQAKRDSSSAPTASCAAASAASWLRACSRQAAIKQGLVLAPVDVVHHGLAWPVAPARRAARAAHPVRAAPTGASA